MGLSDYNVTNIQDNANTEFRKLNCKKKENLKISMNEEGQVSRQCWEGKEIKITHFN